MKQVTAALLILLIIFLCSPVAIGSVDRLYRLSFRHDCGRGESHEGKISNG